MDRIDEIWKSIIEFRIALLYLLYQLINQQSDGALMSLSPSSKIAIQ